VTVREPPPCWIFDTPGGLGGAVGVACRLTSAFGTFAGRRMLDALSHHKPIHDLAALQAQWPCCEKSGREATTAWMAQGVYQSSRPQRCRSTGQPPATPTAPPNPSLDVEIQQGGGSRPSPQAPFPVANSSRFQARRAFVFRRALGSAGSRRPIAILLAGERRRSQENRARSRYVGLTNRLLFPRPSTSPYLFTTIVALGLRPRPACGRPPTALHLQSVEFHVPAASGWQWVERPRAMRKAQLQSPTGYKGERRILFSFRRGGGCGTQANIDLWFQHFQEPKNNFTPMLRR